MLGRCLGSSLSIDSKCEHAVESIRGSLFVNPTYPCNKVTPPSTRDFLLCEFASDDKRHKKRLTEETDECWRKDWVVGDGVSSVQNGQLTLFLEWRRVIAQLVQKHSQSPDIYMRHFESNCNVSVEYLYNIIQNDIHHFQRRQRKSKR